MSGTSHVETTPDFLRTAMEYRDRLKAELAKVDAFLSQADRRQADRQTDKHSDKRPDRHSDKQPDRHSDEHLGARKAEYPEFLLMGNDEVLEALHPMGVKSEAVH